MAKDYGLKYFKAIEKATLTGIGTSQATEGGETFNYLEFKTENGSIEKIEVPTFVPNCMCMNFAQGSSGDFYFGFDNGGKWVLIASDIGGEKRIYSDFRIHTLMGAAGCASIVFGAIFFYVAIPLYIYLRIKRNADARKIRNFLSTDKGFKEFAVS